VLTGPRASLEAHLVAFAAERARQQGVVATVPPTDQPAAPGRARSAPDDAGVVGE
jgi:hypothetical protein